MWQFIMGFASGVYIGSYYECKPTIENILKIIKENSQRKKNKKLNNIIEINKIELFIE